jgi:CMP-2-keto-3-deoxyoctulosonic acid synthetase
MKATAIATKKKATKKSAKKVDTSASALTQDTARAGLAAVLDMARDYRRAQRIIEKEGDHPMIEAYRAIVNSYRAMIHRLTKYGKGFHIKLKWDNGITSSVTIADAAEMVQEGKTSAKIIGFE